MQNPLPGISWLNIWLPGDRLILGHDLDRGEPHLVDQAQRRTHTLITGKSGTGKTMFMAHLLLQSILRGDNVVLIDLIGTLAPYLKEALAHILMVMMARAHRLPPPQRGYHMAQVQRFYRRISFLMLGETSAEQARFAPFQRSAGLDTLEQAALFVAAMERVLDGGMATMRALLLNLTALATVLIDSGGATPADMVELMCMDTKDLKTYLRLVQRKRSQGRLQTSPRPDLLQQYMSRFFAETSQQRRAELVQSTLRGLSLVLSDPVAKQWLSSPRGNLHLPQLMQAGGVKIISLPPLNLHTQRVMGGFVLGQLSALALRRSSETVSRGELPLIHLVIDEFQQIFTPEMAQNIAVYRNKGVALTLAHQSSNQSPFETSEGSSLLHSVDDNSSLKVTFRVGPQDAERFAPQYFFARGQMLKRDEEQAFASTQWTDQQSHVDRQAHTQGQEQRHMQNQLSEQVEQVAHLQVKAQTLTSEAEHRQEHRRLQEQLAASHTRQSRQTQALQDKCNQRSRQTQTVEGQRHFDRGEHAQQHSQEDGRLHQVSSSLERSRVDHRTQGLTRDGQQQLTNQGQEQHRQRQQTRESQNSTQDTHRSEFAQASEVKRGHQATTASQTLHQHRLVHQRLYSQTHERGHSHRNRQQEQTQHQQHQQVETVHQQETRRMEQRVHELRHVREYYSVMEEQIIQAQRFQRLPNRHALILEQGKGLPKVTRIRTLDLPQHWVTEVGGLDGQRELERLCTPQHCDPEPELSLRDRMDVGMPLGNKRRND